MSSKTEQKSDDIGRLTYTEQGDAVECMRRIASESIDLIVTDPPYDSLNKHRYGAQSCLRLREWFPTVAPPYFDAWFAEAFRVLRRNTHCYVMSDCDSARAIEDAGVRAGFRLWKRIIWDKGRAGMGYHWRASYENVIFLEKGKRKLNNLGWRDVISIPGLRGKGLYPTEKPPALFARLIANSSIEGDIVLDPFCGSGASGEAATSLGCHWIGFDVSERAIESTQTRLILS